MRSFLEEYGKAIFVLVIITILITFAHPLGIKIKEYTIAKINQTNSIGTDEVTKTTNGKENNNDSNRPDKPTEAVDQVYCIYYTDGELVISQNEIEPKNGRTVEKQGFYSYPSRCTTKMTTVKFEGAVMPKSCQYWFSQCYNLTQIKNIQNLYTNECTDMSMMFYYCSSLIQLDGSQFDTSNIRNMAAMFEGCNQLLNLNINNWDTSNVKNMKSMFRDCSNLKVLNIENWNPINVTNMSVLFYCCKNLTTINLSKLITNSCTTMHSMFGYCSSLTDLNLSQFDTSNVIDMSGCFESCTNLKSINLKNWDTRKVTNMSEMFFCCKSLQSLDLINFEIYNVTNMYGMFYYCPELTINCSKWNVSKVTEYSKFNYNSPNVIAPTWN